MLSFIIFCEYKNPDKANDNEKWYYFDLVSGEYEIRLGNPDVVGKVCVIGSNIDEEMIKGLFK